MANISYGVNIIPKTNNAYTLGNSDYKWSNIYAVQINGTNVSDLGAVQDVQINSTSILNNGIANIPIATNSTPGVSIASGMGIKVNSLGELYLYPASSTMVKAGTNIYVPIMPTNQHESVFYGLAKAAGDSTQAASSNTVGTYTDNAKTAIQNMLAVAPTNNPVFTGSISLGRYASSTVGENSLAIGNNVVAQGAASVALGAYTKSWEAYSFSGGTSVQAWGEGSFAYGGGIVAAYPYSAAFGHGCAVTNISDWEANKSYSIGDIVYAQGYTFRCKVAHTSGSTFSSENNWEPEWGNVLIVGNGDATQSNALTLHNSGRLSIKDYIYVGANADGSGGTRIPHDIQINGTSIVSNGVANIPKGDSYGNLGVVYCDSDYGTQINKNGRINISKATDTQIKAGSGNYKPLTPAVQHAAAFYGLAKAAGDATQASSSNAVGVYTDSAKTAIQNMLSVPSTDSPTFTGSFSHNRKANTTVGPVSAVIGYDNTAEGSCAIAMGHNNMAYAQGSIALGNLNTIYGDSAVAIGYKNIAQYQSSFVFGSYNAIDTITDWTSNVEYNVGDLVYNYGYVFECLTAHTSESTIDYSKWRMVLKYLFVIGNGHGENARSNALAVNTEGDLRIKGNLYIDCNADSSGGTLLAPIEVIRL